MAKASNNYDNEFEQSNDDGDCLNVELVDDEEDEDQSDLDGDAEEEEGDEDVSVDHSQSEKKTRQPVAWEFEKEFNNLEEVEAELVNKWKFWKEHVTGGGLKEYYNCVWPKCPRKMHLYYRAVDQICMLNNQCDHQHDLARRPRGIALPMQQKIDELYCTGVEKPLNIVYALRKIYTLDQVPTKRQISNYLSTLRKRLYGVVKLSFNEFERYCFENSDMPGRNEMDKPYVLGYIKNFYKI